jgi:tRNA(Arg) A34 adenosine deaminase TadA
MCFSAIHWARNSRIVYGCGIDDAKEAGFNELCLSNEILKKSGGLDIIIEKECLRDENRELFRKWIQSETKKAY